MCNSASGLWHLFTPPTAQNAKLAKCEVNVSCMVAICYKEAHYRANWAQRYNFF